MTKNMYTVWYAKEPKFYVKKSLTVSNLPDSHVQIPMSIVADDLEDVFWKMQGENWSPDGRYRWLIEKLDLYHTSMSVGDVIEDIDADKFYQVDSVGFQELRR